MERALRGFTHLGAVVSPDAGYRQMQSCRCDIDGSRFDGFLALGFADRYLAQMIEAVGKLSGETNGHVLHDQNTDWQLGGQLGKDFLQGLRTARRSANRDDRGG